LSRASSGTPPCPLLTDVLPESTINIHSIFEDLIKSGYIKPLENQNAFIILKTIEKNYSF
jgi:hypothetical protein